eukprot:Nk52_evm1s2116 gene=Nk52_evmTU1s2116
MSTRSKLTFLCTCLGTAATIAYVQWDQNSERERMQKGVEKDLERQERKAQNLREQKEQIAIRERIEKEMEREDGRVK